MTTQATPGEDVVRLREVLNRCVRGIDHLSELARLWEPDHSSGKDRQGWVLARDARDDAIAAIAAIDRLAALGVPASPSGSTFQPPAGASASFVGAVEALRALDERLRDCMNAPILASDAYDSFYQELVASALLSPPGDTSRLDDIERHGWGVERDLDGDWNLVQFRRYGAPIRYPARANLRDAIDAARGIDSPEGVEIGTGSTAKPQEPGGDSHAPKEDRHLASTTPAVPQPTDERGSTQGALADENVLMDLYDAGWADGCMEPDPLKRARAVMEARASMGSTQDAAALHVLAPNWHKAGAEALRAAMNRIEGELLYGFGRDDQGASEDARADAGGTGEPVRTGTNEHYEHRAGQSDVDGAQHQRDSEGAGLPGESEVRAAVVATPGEDVVRLREECKRLARKLALAHADGRDEGDFAESQRCYEALEAEIDRLASLATAPPVAAGQPLASLRGMARGALGDRTSEEIVEQARNEWAASVPAPTPEEPKDALRYRHLRDNSLGQWAHPIVFSQERLADGRMRYVGPLAGADLDAAVDAAIAAAPTET
jgi:hypothetical protein